MRKYVLTFLVIIVCIGVWIWRYQSVLRSMPGYKRFCEAEEREPLPMLTAKQALMLGWAHTQESHPENSYLKFPEKKEKDTIRIGLFGCSYIECREVAKHLQFASFLQKKFHEQGFKNVEVINFAKSAYGVAQSYMMWKFLGKHYDLDYVVFFVFGCHIVNRDNTFVFTDKRIEPLHARYIIKNNKLMFIPVYGNTPNQAQKKYFSLIPLWRYIRYDYKMPLFLRAVLPDFLRERSNPFYYRAGIFDKEEMAEEEIFGIYTLLLNDLAAEAKNLIIVTDEDIFDDMSSNFTNPNTFFLKSKILFALEQDRYELLYDTFTGHFSGLKNYLLSEEIFYLLTGHDRFGYKIIETRSVLSKPAVLTNNSPLCYYKDISLNIGSNSIGSFVIGRNDSVFEGHFKKLDFKEYKIKSLLLMPGAAQRFIPLDFLLDSEKQIFLKFYMGDKCIRIPIADVSGVTPAIGIINLFCDEQGTELIRRGPGWSVEIDKYNGIFRINIKADKNISSPVILYGEEEILRGEIQKPDLAGAISEILEFRKYKERDIIFNPVFCSYVYIRGGKNDFIDVNKLNSDDKIDVVMTDTQGNKSRSPLFLLKIKNVGGKRRGTQYLIH